MRRREFLGTAVYAALAAKEGLSAVPESPEKDLLALADVIVPDRNTDVWRDSQVVQVFLDDMEGLKGEEKASVDALLTALRAVSERSGNGSFASFSREERTALLKRTLSGEEGLDSAFGLVRTEAVRAFYGSSLGQQRTGYRDTTQFVGYPGYVRDSEIWEE